MLFALGTGAFALVAARDSPDKNPPIFISELTVSDAWMSGLTKQNWQKALFEQTYVEGSYIWFIAKISVSACDDTDSGQLWTNGDEEAVLTVTSKDNCLDFTGAGLANFALIQGMDVLSEGVDPNNGGLVEARAERVTFKFGCLAMQYPPTTKSALDKTLNFTEDLANLKMDGIYPEHFFGKDANYATLQKDYYLHFMAIANAATEGVCTATLKVNDTDAHTFLRDPAGQLDENAVYVTENWWETVSESSNSQLNPGDRSYIYRFDNTVNGNVYSIMRINGVEAANSVGRDAPFDRTDSIYVVMNESATVCHFGFAVESSGRIQGLVHWDNDKKDVYPGAFTSAYTNAKTWDAGYYSHLITNAYGSDITAIGEDITINATELRAIFSYFGIARTNPAYVDDATFLAPRTGRAGSSRAAKETTAEARYNVSSGNSDLDALFVTPNTGAAQPEQTPAPTAAPDPLKLEALPMNLAP